MNFAIVNRTIEEDAGLRKKKSRAEELASAFISLMEGSRKASSCLSIG